MVNDVRSLGAWELYPLRIFKIIKPFGMTREMVDFGNNDWLEHFTATIVLNYYAINTSKI